MAIVDIGIISVPVSDQDRSLAFYVDVLGFELLDDSPMGPSMRWVRVTPSSTAQTSITLVTWFPTMTPGSSKGLLLNSDSLEEDIERIRAKGVDIGEVQQEAWGRYVTFDDPDGNGIILRGAVTH